MKPWFLLLGPRFLNAGSGKRLTGGGFMSPGTPSVLTVSSPGRDAPTPSVVSLQSECPTPSVHSLVSAPGSVVPKCRSRKKTLCVEAFQSCPCHASPLGPRLVPRLRLAVLVMCRSARNPVLLVSKATSLPLRFTPGSPCLRCALTRLFCLGSPVLAAEICVWFLNSLLTGKPSRTFGAELRTGPNLEAALKGQRSTLETSLSFGLAVTM